MQTIAGMLVYIITLYISTPHLKLFVLPQGDYIWLYLVPLVPLDVLESVLLIKPKQNRFFYKNICLQDIFLDYKYIHILYF